MAQESDATEPRLSGEAAWKAARDATERRNSEAKRRASAQTTATTSAALDRERRLAAAESAQLQVLNEHLRARAADRAFARDERGRRLRQVRCASESANARLRRARAEAARRTGV